MRLSNSTVPSLVNSRLILPPVDYLSLPVKVLQFGTGVLLRGLPDHVIDKANKQRIFNGRIVVIKSTAKGTTNSFSLQDNIYTVLVKGIENKQFIESATINTSISRVLSAQDEWAAVLKESENPELRIIISNTTEVGIQLIKEKISENPPLSFPAKLLAVLYHRYKTFGASKEHGLIIVPTELLPDNAIVLKSILMELIEFNNLEQEFVNWVNQSNHFCNSLVDRIVPGTPPKAEHQLFEQINQYEDELMIVAEPYLLWAIEGNEEVKNVLSFERADSGVIVAPDITMYRELKLRLLNGTHTLSCAVAFLLGFNFVNEATDDSRFVNFLQKLMFEIRSAMPCQTDPKIAEEFADRVLDRFRNPYIRHPWISIAQQYTTKIRTRVLPVLKEYYERYQTVPENVAIGFAAYLFFVRPATHEHGEYFSEYKGIKYPLQDENAGKLIEKWKFSTDYSIPEILKSTEIWGEDLTLLPGFADAVQHYLDKIIKGELNLIL
jgi:tagaturonate reductase